MYTKCTACMAKNVTFSNESGDTFFLRTATNGMYECWLFKHFIQKHTTAQIPSLTHT